MEASPYAKLVAIDTVRTVVGVVNRDADGLPLRDRRVRQALYAVNRRVEFTPYRTTFELAECRVGRRHWSRAR